MQKCITSNGNGIISRLKLLMRTLSLIIKSAPFYLLIVLISEFLIGLLQTFILIAWQYVVNNVEKFLLISNVLNRLTKNVDISLICETFL